LNLAAIERELAADHPLRPIRLLADDALAKLAAIFVALRSGKGPSPIPLARLLKSTLLMALYGVRDPFTFCEQTADNVGLRWFLDMRTGEGLDLALFQEGQASLGANHMARSFLVEVLGKATRAGLIDQEHFSVDQARIDGWSA
jgi:hypothetical protein